MTDDEIIELAKQAQFPIFGTKVVATDPMQQIMADAVTQHYHDSAIQFAKLVAERERTFCIQFLMELHSAQMGAHNYFHYAAQALSQLEGKELPSKFSLTIDKEKPIKKYND